MCLQEGSQLRTSKKDYLIKQLFSSITSLYKMGTSLKGNKFEPRSELFPLGAIPYAGMENHFYQIRWHPLNVTIFIMHMRRWVMLATPMVYR